MGHPPTAIRSAACRPPRCWRRRSCMRGARARTACRPSQVECMMQMRVYGSLRIPRTERRPVRSDAPSRSAPLSGGIVRAPDTWIGDRRDERRACPPRKAIGRSFGALAIRSRMRSRHRRRAAAWTRDAARRGDEPVVAVASRRGRPQPLDLIDDPHLVARNYWTGWANTRRATFSRRRRCASTRLSCPLAAPTLGQHNRAALGGNCRD